MDMRSYTSKGKYQVGGIGIIALISLFSFSTLSAPLARQPDLKNQSSNSQKEKTKKNINTEDNDFLMPSTEELLSGGSLLKTEKGLPDQLPEELPEDLDFTPPPSKKAQAPSAPHEDISELPSDLKDSPTAELLGIPPTAQENHSQENLDTPPAPTATPPSTSDAWMDSASELPPEVDTDVTGIDSPKATDEATDGFYEDTIQGPSEEEKLVGDPHRGTEEIIPDQEEESEREKTTYHAQGESEKKWIRGVPRYDQENPFLGLQFIFSPNALGSSLSVLNETGTQIEDYSVYQIGLAVEWLPKFIQSIGVIGIGASANLYPISPLNGFTNASTDIWSWGGMVKYQAKYMRGQWIVPYAGYEIQQLNYTTQSNEIGNGYTTLTGPFFGTMLLLNWLEPSSAFEMYKNTGIKRNYLFGEMKTLTSSYEPYFSTDGFSLHFGLRFEL